MTKGKSYLPIAATAAGGFALTVLVAYPGYLTNDATYIYQYMQSWSFGDWQSPLMSMLWWIIDPIAPGPGSMFLLMALSYWLGFAMVGLALARRSAWLGIAVPLVAFVPPSVMMLAMIWRDVLSAAAWLLAAAIVFVSTGHARAATAAGSLSHRERGGVRGNELSMDPNPLTPTLSPAGRGSPAVSQSESEYSSLLRAVTAVAALVLIGFGVLLRPTAFIAAPFLLGYTLWPLRFDFKRTAVLFIPALALGYALIHVVYYVVLDVSRENPLHSVFVFDLGGITHFSGENQFPVTWSAEETALLTSKCYDPDRWDSYWTLEPCRFVMQRLERPGDVIFGTSRLAEAWKRAVTTQPLAYLRHRLTFFWTFLANPDTLTLELYDASDPARTPLAGSIRFKAVVALNDVLKSTILFRPGFWLILAGIVCALAMPVRATPAGAFAIAVSGSGAIYVLTFLPFGVAADFRYGYWCVVACLVAALALLAAYREDAPPG